MAVRKTLFQSNRSQAVRLPKDVSFPAHVREVVILREEPSRSIVPADSNWDDFFDSPGIAFLDHGQLARQEREVWLDETGGR